MIQEQHQQKTYPTFVLFIPYYTLVNINIDRPLSSAQFDWDLTECLSFVEEPGQWLLTP